MCFVDAAMIFYPIATFALVFTGIRLWKQYNKSKQKSNGTPGTAGNVETVS